MKILALGDIHGRNHWKEITSKETFDLVVFVGDYFDTHDRGYSPNRQLENFKEILEFKKANKDKVILLTGNHDYHYIPEITERYSGYNPNYAKDFGVVIKSALKEDFLQMCFSIDNLLFSHAGVTKTWCAANEIDLTDIANSINSLFKTDKKAFGFTYGRNFDSSGDDITQPPIWVRPISLCLDSVNNYKQIVGHTTVRKISVFEKIPAILIDALGTSKEYLVYENVPEPTFIIKSI